MGRAQSGCQSPAGCARVLAARWLWPVQFQRQQEALHRLQQSCSLGGGLLLGRRQSRAINHQRRVGRGQTGAIRGRCGAMASVALTWPPPMGSGWAREHSCPGYQPAAVGRALRCSQRTAHQQHLTPAAASTKNLRQAKAWRTAAEPHISEKYCHACPDFHYHQQRDGSGLEHQKVMGSSHEEHYRVLMPKVI